MANNSCQHGRRLNLVHICKLPPFVCFQGGSLEIARAWPYVDGSRKFEVAENKSLREGYTSRDGEGRCSYPSRQSTILGRALHSWDSHTEEDLENILLDGHAVVTTMEITPDLQHYSSGVYFSPECQHWRLGEDRDYQWEPESGLRPPNHALVIVGFGVDYHTGLQYWKAKNSWGELWGESGFIRIQRGYGLCGIGAYISVALCGPPSPGIPLPSPNLDPPTELPLEGVFLGQSRNLASPLAVQGTLQCSITQCPTTTQCQSSRPCRLPCGPLCQRRGGAAGSVQCCRNLGGRGGRVYCPRIGTDCL